MSNQKLPQLSPERTDGKFQDFAAVELDHEKIDNKVSEMSEPKDDEDFDQSHAALLQGQIKSDQVEGAEVSSSRSASKDKQGDTVEVVHLQFEDIDNKPQKSIGQNTGLGSFGHRGSAESKQIEMMSQPPGTSKAKTNQVVPVASNVASSGAAASQIQSQSASDPKASGVQTRDDQMRDNKTRQTADDKRKAFTGADKELSATHTTHIDYAHQKALRIQKENLRNFKFVNQKLNEMQMTMNIKKDFEAEIEDRMTEAEQQKAQEDNGGDESEVQDDDQVQQSDLKQSIKASDNMHKYLEKHAVNIKIPTYQTESSKIYKKDPQYFLQLCRYSIPGEQDDNRAEDKKRWKEVASFIGEHEEPVEEEIVTNKEPLIQRAQDKVKDILKKIKPQNIEISEPEIKEGEKVQKKRFAVKRKDLTQFVNHPYNQIQLDGHKAGKKGKIGEKACIKSIGELYGKKTKGLILRLMKRNVDDPSTPSVIEDCDCNCSFNFSGRPVRQIKISLSSDSNQIAIYYKEHRTIRIFSIDSSKPAVEAFTETFKNIEDEQNKNYMEHTLRSPMSKLWFNTYDNSSIHDSTDAEQLAKLKLIEERKNWMLMMNDKEIEVIDYERDPEFAKQGPLADDGGKETKAQQCKTVLRWSISKQISQEHESILDARIDVLAKIPTVEVAGKRANDQKIVDVFAVEVLNKDGSMIGEKNTNIMGTMKKLGKQNEKSIIFNRADESLQVKISQDLNQVILVNNYEGYILSKTKSGDQDENDKYIINKLSQLEGERKYVRSIFYDQSKENSKHFLILVSKQYDKQFEILHSKYSRDEFKIDVKFSFEPEKNRIQIHDVFEVQKGEKQKAITVTASNDGGFFHGVANFKVQDGNDEHCKNTIEPHSIDVKIEQKRMIPCFSFKWPYICFESIIPNHVNIINVDEPDLIHNVEISHGAGKVVDTFITEQDELFVIVQHFSSEVYQRPKQEKEPITSDAMHSENLTYKLYKINLSMRSINLSDQVQTEKRYQTFIPVKVLEYNINDVGGQELKKIWIRGSSSKQKFDNKQKYICFMLHEKSLWSWTKDRHMEEDSDEEEDRAVRKCLEDVGIECQVIDEELEKMNANKRKQRIQDQKEKVRHKQAPGLRMVCNTHQECFKIEDSNTILVMKEPAEGSGELQEIRRITCEFVSFVEETAYVNLDKSVTILDFEVDTDYQKIVIFSKNEKLADDQFGAKFIDMESKKAIDYVFNKEENLELYGRLECGQYEFQGGHIYYNNNVIKVRYDLIDRPEALNYSFDQLLDNYSNIFKLKDNMDIALGFPHDSKFMNKLVYVIKNCQNSIIEANESSKPDESTVVEFESKAKIMVLPYLHEKKLYTSHRKNNTNYFITQLPCEKPNYPNQFQKIVSFKDDKDHTRTSQKSIVQINLTESIFEVFTQRGLRKHQVDFSDKIKKDGKLYGVSQNGMNYIFLKRVCREEKQEERPMNEDGRSSLPTLSGKRKSYYPDQVMSATAADEHSEDHKKAYDIALTVYTLTETDFLFVKRIHILHQVDDLIEKIKASNPDRSKLMALEEDWMWHFGRMDYKFLINDKMDIIAQFNSTLPWQKKLKDDGGKVKQIYYFIAGPVVDGHPYNKRVSKQAAANLTSSLKKTSFGADGKALENTQDDKQFLTFIGNKDSQFFTSKEHYVIEKPDKPKGKGYPRYYQLGKFNFEHQIRENGKLQTQENFTINSRYVIFWNRLQVLTIDLQAPTIERGAAIFQNVLPSTFPHKIDYTDGPDKGRFRETSKDSINDVLVGKNGNEIFLVVDCLDHNQHILIKYDIEAQQEMKAFTIQGQFEVVWDENGKAYIVQEDKVIFVETECTVKCFEDTKLKMSYGQNRVLFQRQSKNRKNGYLMDGENHNYLLHEEYSILGYSYMTFVIKDKIEKKDAQSSSNEFDIAPYNYLFNKATSIIDSNEVLNDNPAFFKQILQDIREYDQTYLDQLNYVENNDEDKRYSALHIALADKDNDRDVEVLLKYLCMTPINVNNYSDIIHTLIKFQNFVNFAEQMSFQNQMMQEYSSIQTYEPFNEEKGIVNVVSTPNQLISDNVLEDWETGTAIRKAIRYLYSRIMDYINSQSQKSNFAVNVKAVRIDWMFKPSDGNMKSNSDGISEAGLDFFQGLRRSKNLDLFNNETTKMMIEFYYQTLKYPIVICYVALSCAQLTVFIIAMIATERYVLSSTKEDSLKLDAKIFSIVNCILTIFQFILGVSEVYSIIIKRYWLCKWNENDHKGCRRVALVLKKMINRWCYLDEFLDLSYVILNGILSIDQIHTSYGVGSHTQTINDQATMMLRMRIISSFLSLVLILKVLKTGMMLDSCYDAINSFFFVYMGNGIFLQFTIILIMFIIACSFPFWLLSKQMVQFELKSDSIYPEQQYGYAIWYVVMLIVNPENIYFQQDGYQPDEISQSMITRFFILFFFFIALFIIVIQLLNLLVAIMTDNYSTFRQSSLVYKQIQQVHNIVKLWHLKSWADPFCQQRLQDQNYIICAFAASQDSEEMSAIQQLVTDSSETKAQLQIFQDHVLNEIKDIKQEQVVQFAEGQSELKKIMVHLGIKEEQNKPK